MSLQYRVIKPNKEGVLTPTEYTLENNNDVYYEISSRVKDKAGRTIYVNDIVLYDNAKYKVVFENHFRLIPMSDYASWYDELELTPYLSKKCEVVGNLTTEKR